MVNRSILLAHSAGNSPVIGEFPFQKASNSDPWFFFIVSLSDMLNKQYKAGDLKYNDAHVS